MNTIQEPAENYSFLEGGLFSKVQRRLGIQNHQVALAVAGICFAWLPLFIFSLLDGKLWDGASVPFLHDIAMKARFLIALPVFILIRNVIDIKTTAVIKYMTISLLGEEERQRMLTVVLPKMRRWACSSLTEAIMLIIVFGSVWSLVQKVGYGGLQGDGSNWRFIGLPADNMLSLAGKWAAFISLPFFQFLLLQWVWRYIVWMILLFHFATAKLILLPTHADRSGGIGIIILAQRSFSLLLATVSIVLSGQLIVYVLHSRENIQFVGGIGIGYILLCIVLLLLPLFFFMGKLVRTKQVGLLRLSKLSSELSTKFEKEWLNDIVLEKRIEEQQVDPSMAYDYSCLYDLLQEFRVIPLLPRDIITFVITIAIPFLPILFVYFSAVEVLQKIVGLLL